MYIFTKNTHCFYISPLRGTVISQLIVMKFGTAIDLSYVINYAKFSVDWSLEWGLVSNQILGFFWLYLRMFLTLHFAAAHAVMVVRSTCHKAD